MSYAEIKSEKCGETIMVYRKAILELLRIAIDGAPKKDVCLVDVDWYELLRLSASQGVKGLVWEGIQIQKQNGFLQMDLDSMLEWFGQIRNMETDSLEMQEKSTDIARQLATCNNSGSVVNIVVLKGVDYAQLWPNPLHREFGDLDIYSGDDIGIVNENACSCGMKVEWHGYKHTHLHHEDILVENHKFFTEHNQSKKGLLTEKYLKDLLESETLCPIKDTFLFSPPPMFTAVFLLAHAQNHFITEGLVLKQILDWLFFLRKNSSKLDFVRLKEIYKETGIWEFFNMMTTYCEKVLGIKVFVEYDEVSDDLLKKVQEDIWNHIPLDRSASKTIFQRFKGLIRRVKRFLKYRSLLKESILRSLYDTFVNGFFLRNPDNV